MQIYVLICVLSNVICSNSIIHSQSQKIPITHFELQGFHIVIYVLNYLLSAVATSTAQATVQPTIGLLPIPRKPIIST